MINFNILKERSSDYVIRNMDENRGFLIVDIFNENGEFQNIIIMNDFKIILQENDFIGNNISNELEVLLNQLNVKLLNGYLIDEKILNYIENSNKITDIDKKYWSKELIIKKIKNCISNVVNEIPEKFLNDIEFLKIIISKNNKIISSLDKSLFNETLNNFIANDDSIEYRYIPNYLKTFERTMKDLQLGKDIFKYIPKKFKENEDIYKYINNFYDDIPKQFITRDFCMKISLLNRQIETEKIPEEFLDEEFLLEFIRKSKHIIGGSPFDLNKKLIKIATPKVNEEIMNYCIRNNVEHRSFVFFDDCRTMKDLIFELNKIKNEGRNSCSFVSSIFDDNPKFLDEVLKVFPKEEDDNFSNGYFRRFVL